MKHRHPEVMIFIGMRNDHCFKPPSSGCNLVGQLFGLANSKLTIDQDCLAFSIDQTRGDVPAILAHEYVEMSPSGDAASAVFLPLPIRIAPQASAKITIVTGNSAKLRIVFMRVTLLNL